MKTIIDLNKVNFLVYLVKIKHRLKLKHNHLNLEYAVVAVLGSYKYYSFNLIIIWLRFKHLEKKESINILCKSFGSDVSVYARI